MSKVLLKEYGEFLPKVSIVIPVYNGANYLRDAIDSALAQDYPNIEIVIVNDGSVDQGKTEQIAISYGNKVRYFYKKNGGVATALNYGIREMKGEYFSWLSHDDIYMNNKISKAVESLAQLKDKKRVVCCGYRVVDENQNFLYEINPVKEYGTDSLKIPLFPVFRCCINGCGLMIHKSHFERIGTFDEKLLTTQDYDFWFRLLRGEQLHFIDDICFYSRSHKAQGSIQLFDRHIEECNALWIRLFNSLTSAEKCAIGGNEYNFLLQERIRFNETGYDEVVNYLDREILREFVFLQRNKIEGEIISDKIRLVITDYEDMIYKYANKYEDMLQLNKSFLREKNLYIEKYNMINNSQFWKITKPFRVFCDFLKTLK